ncbi:asparagine synthetase [glutamine-hydrolyzing] 3-like [Rosa rugosa]|uniref:asparagine synthetase [glutamine-hydrolyzing] 3-like n=1 Tax=Rosa rugosa TaxID=74645 RepID=UPI002B40F04F|nr:asparagine synthetase [glutamine-hydrolyzing] 3-like [Rosa rugosa]
MAHILLSSTFKTIAKIKFRSSVLPLESLRLLTSGREGSLSNGKDWSFTYFQPSERDNSQATRSRIIELSRGPDWSGLHCHGDCYLAHQRLAIVDPASGDQPLYNEDKTVIVTAVLKRLMTDVPFGVLLSGGLDSSLVAAVACRYLAKSEAARQWWSQLHTFCVGLEGSPDLKAAREVADYLGTHHHEFHFTVQEGIDALEAVIYHIETYDVTTVRASTPMFLMSRKIKSLGVKMVLSGEGSDEIFGGYFYFHKAPNKEEFHQETCQKIKGLHLYDCLRANKSTSAWGVEARVPFLDKEFIKTAMDIDPEWKMIMPDLGRIEKWVLRKAFDDDQKPYLPKHILYRQKEQFSDDVGYSWIDGLKDHANKQVTDSMLMNASFVYPESTPTTKEGCYYRTIFEKYFPKHAVRSTVPGGPSVACSTAKAVEWDAEWSKNPDPSGRAALGIHAAAYEESKDVKTGSLVSDSPQKLVKGVAESGCSSLCGMKKVLNVTNAFLLSKLC